MANNGLIARLQPTYSSAGGPADGPDLTEIAGYAAAYGNYASESSTARAARSGTSLWDGLIVTETDTNLTWLYTSGWQLLFHGLQIHRGDSYLSAASAAFGTSMAVVSGISVTASTIGGRVRAQIMGYALNGNSGVARTAQFGLYCDGAQVGDLTPLLAVPFVSGTTGSALVHTVRHTPSAGSHIWTVEALASAASAVELATCELTVEEYL